ncbi:MAG: PilN domain-containing protein [Thermodesulfobacteriota bacterium]
MILINLLPVRHLKKRARARSEALVFVSVFVLLCAILGGWVLKLNMDVKQMQNEVARLQKKKQSYDATLKEIKQIEAQKAKLFEQIEVIKQLKAKSQVSVHVLDEIARATPPNGVWLTSLKQSGPSLTIAGTALDNTTIASYMNKLSGSRYIQGTTLGTSTQKVVANRNLQTFTLTMTVTPPVEGGSLDDKGE